MNRIVRLREYLADCRRAVSWAAPIASSGRLTRVSGLVMEAVGLRLPVGSQCNIQIPGGQTHRSRGGRILRRPPVPHARNRRLRRGAGRARGSGNPMAAQPPPAGHALCAAPPRA